MRNYNTSQAKLYFDQNDEFTIEDLVPEIISHRKQVATIYDRCGLDADNFIDERWTQV